MLNPRLKSDALKGRKAFREAFEGWLLKNGRDIHGGGGCNLQDAEAVLAMPPRFRRVILLDAMRA